MESILASCLFASLAQTVTIQPDHVLIPQGQNPLDAWPVFERNPACGHVTFTVSYTLGAPMAAGGGIRIGIGYPTLDHSNPAFVINDGFMLGPTNALSRFPIGQFQVTNPAGANFCAAGTSDCVLTTSIIKRTRLGRESLLSVITPSALPAGATLTATLGRGLGMNVSFAPGSPKLYVSEDLAGKGTYTLTRAALPTILFTGTHADRFVVNGPVTAIAGIPFRITVRAVQGADNPGENSVLPVELYDDCVSLSSSDGAMTVAPTDRTGGHFVGGVRSLTVTLGTPGIQTITVLGGDRTKRTIDLPQGMSNGIFVQPVGSNLQILCGDYHRHTAEGGHAAEAGDLAWWDLWNEREDFGCVLQHSEVYMSGYAHTNVEARAFQAAVDPEERQFVCFPGYEFTLLGGHRNVFSRDFTTDKAMTSLDYAGFEIPGPILAKDVQTFLDTLKSFSVPQLAMPHHTLWHGNGRSGDGAPFDWVYEWGANKNDSLQPVVEIFSSHGSSEVWLASCDTPDQYPLLGALDEQRPANNLSTVRDALKLGYRFGIVANSDRHGYSTGATVYNEGYTRTGLTFVRTDLTTGPMRGRIWNAMTHRHTYATTGCRMVLDWVTASGTDMGGEEVTATPRFTIDAHASGIGIMSRPLFTKLQVVRDDVVVDSEALSASDVNWTWSDPAPLNDGACHSYYARIVQSDWHVGWTSPIWIKHP